MYGTLYIVPTPIGNLKDITIRALEVLNNVDFILCENPKNSLKLLNHYNIKKPLKSYNKKNEKKIYRKYLQLLKENKNLALISDAGTPGISDSGYLLIKKCIDEGIKIECLPGPTALIPSLLLSGFPTQPFAFWGFLPTKKKNKLLKHIFNFPFTSIIYESPHRLKKTLKLLEQNLNPNKKICICKELTKTFETIIRGKISEIPEKLNNIILKGEFVIIIEPQNIEAEKI